MPASTPTPPVEAAGLRAALLTLFALFAISGASGLIYQSVWAQYLKLLLGHAAHAQTLVLVIFMGGMALGAWQAARRTLRWHNLLMGYAVVELLIGLAGVVFHATFDTAMTLTHDHVLPALGGGTPVTLVTWGLATALVLPQSVLLGMSFPLLSGAVIRRRPEQAGDTVAMLYFTNSIGAALGVLASGFVLIPAVGLPGTVLAAGLINVALALLVWVMARGTAWQSAPTTGAAVPRTATDPAAPETAAGAAAPDAAAAGTPRPSAALAHGPRLLLVIAFATGLASFVYEIGWIRMLSLVLGASTHAFELMLSAFILGLALGSLWIRRRIDALADTGRFLGVVQVVMGVLALGTLLVYGSTFELMATVLQALERNDAAYGLFNIASHGIAMLVMLPVTFCAGMTLPLITSALLRGGHGERSIGQVYAANTLGAIAGVALAVHVLMPMIGLKGLICIGAAIDILAGAVLLLWPARSGRAAARRAPALRAWLWPAVGAAALAASVFGVHLDVYRMASGVFRYGHLDIVEGARVTLHTDGKTASISLVEFPVGIVSIMTNGKSDGSIQMRGESAVVSGDELTMTLIGALGLAAHPQPRQVAVIGFGTGMSTHTVLGSDRVEHVDTIEIEPRMVAAAQVFRPRVPRAFEDPRGHLTHADARTFFASSGRRYDLILSEPSNPWVSGIAALYTTEYYQRVQRSLAADGRFVQWIHVSEMSMTLLSSIMRALGAAFEDYTLHNLNGSDLLIIAGQRGQVQIQPALLFEQLALRADLARIGVEHAADLSLRYLGSRALLEPLLLSYPSPPNSDYFPVLDLGAVRARFLREDAFALLELRMASLPVVEMLDARAGAARLGADAPATVSALFEESLALRNARQFAASLAMAEDAWPALLDPELHRLRTQAALLWPTCGAPPFAGPWQQSLRDLRALAARLSAAEVEALVGALRAHGCATRLPEPLALQVALLAATGARDAAAMVELGRAALGSPDIVDSGVRRDLLAAVLLGHLSLAQPGAAVQADRQFAAGAALAETDVEIRMLRTLAHARAGD